jgi:hypothetical protein
MVMHPMTVQRNRVRIIFPGGIIDADEMIEIRPITTDELWVFAAISALEVKRVYTVMAKPTQADG